MAVLDIIESEGLQQNALEVGNRIVDGIKTLAKKHECIGDIRGSGFFKAVELVDDRDSKKPATEKTARVVNALRDHGILTGSIGPHDNILKLRPPMVFTREHADLFAGALDEVLAGPG